MEKKPKYRVRNDELHDGHKAYDTVGQIAAEWLNKNPDQHMFTGNYHRKLRLVTMWIETENHLTNATGQRCDGVNVSGGRIHPGQILILPPGHGITNPERAVENCDVNVPHPTPKDIPVVVQDIEPPLATTTVASNNPKPPEPFVFVPHEFVGQSSQATYGKTYMPGSSDHAYLTLARSGLIPNFTKNYFGIHNIAARHAVKKERYSGQVDGDFLMEGDWRGKDKESRLDDNTEEKRNGMTGTRHQLGITNPRARVYDPGYTPKINEDGSYERSDKDVLTFAFSRNNYAVTIWPFGTVNLWIPRGTPVGGAFGRPAREEPLEAETRRWGISQVDVALGKVNPGGKDNISPSEKAVLSSPMVTPDRIYAHMFLLNAQKTFIESMRKVEDKSATPEAKQEAAEKALTAWRDFGDNMLIRRVDGLNESITKSSKAVRDYLETQNVNVKAIDAKLDSLPRLAIVDMPEDQLKHQQNGGHTARYKGIKPGETNAAYKAGEKYAYRTMNYFEAQLAKNNFNDLAEGDMVTKSRETWQSLTAKPETIKAIGAFVAHDTNAQIEIGQLLRDVNRNFENYGFKNKDEAEKYLKPFFAGNKPAERDVTRQGNTSILPLIPDKALPVAQPELYGPVVGKVIQEKPELFADLIKRATAQESGKSDGRRFPIALLRSMGAEIPPYDKTKDGVDPSGFASILATLPNDDAKTQFRSAVTDVTAYAEKGSTGRSVKGVNQLDNESVKAQHGEGQGDQNTIYKNLFTSTDARKNGADLIAVLGMTAHAPLARDAVLATLIRNPKAFDGAIDKLDKLAGAHARQDYDTLRDVLERTKAAISGTDPKAMKEAAQDFGRFFIKMEARATKNSGALRNNAWNALITAISQDKVMTGEIVQTIEQDAPMRDAFIKAVPDAIETTNSARMTNHGKMMGKGRSFPSTSSDDVYTSRFITLPTNHGHVKNHTGFLGGKTQATVNIPALTAAVQGNTGVTTPVAPQAIVNPDGSKTTHHTNGSDVTVNTDGSFQVTNPDKTTVPAFQPKGAVRTTATDGSTVFTQADGSKMTVSPDGTSLTVTSKDGTTATASMEGSQLTTGTDGTVGVNPNGSPNANIPNGYPITISPEALAAGKVLGTQGITNTPNDILHTNPIIIASDTPTAVSNLTSRITTVLKDNPSQVPVPNFPGSNPPRPMTPVEMAQTLIDSGLVHVSTPDQIVHTMTAIDTDASIVTAGGMGVVRGVDLRPLLILLWPPKVFNPPLPNGTIPVCNCPLPGMGG